MDKKKTRISLCGSSKSYADRGISPYNFFSMVLTASLKSFQSHRINSCPFAVWIETALSIRFVFFAKRRRPITIERASCERALSSVPSRLCFETNWCSAMIRTGVTDISGREIGAEVLRDSLLKGGNLFRFKCLCMRFSKERHPTDVPLRLDHSALSRKRHISSGAEIPSV